MSWTKEFPKFVTKKDLEGKKLRIVADIPPKRSTNGLYELTVMDTADSKLYITLCTLRDLSAIVHDFGGSAFTFAPDAKNDKWSNVCGWLEK